MAAACARPSLPACRVSIAARSATGEWPWCSSIWRRKARPWAAATDSPPYWPARSSSNSSAAGGRRCARRCLGLYGCLQRYRFRALLCQPWLLEDYLRDQLGFDGIVMADGLAVDRLEDMAGSIPAAGRAALLAGVDVSLWMKDSRASKNMWMTNRWRPRRYGIASCAGAQSHVRSLARRWCRYRRNCHARCRCHRAGHCGWA